jgi:hypothetical protein
MWRPALLCIHRQIRGQGPVSIPQALGGEEDELSVRVPLGKLQELGRGEAPVDVILGAD